MAEPMDDRLRALEEEVEALRDDLGEMRTALQTAAAALAVGQWPAADRT